MRNLCIIPARGGSKRIPKKNIKDFLGKPIIAYSIETAITSVLFDEVMVSTDDYEIADIAKKYNAVVPFLRTSETANDFATTIDVLKEVLANERYKNVENVCCLYPTAPLVNAEQLKNGFLKLADFDTVFSIQKFSFPIQRAFLKTEDKINWISPEYAQTRSQDLPECFHDAGQFYWFKKSILDNNNSLLTENTAGVELDEMMAQDIDNESDWKMAELKYKILYGI